MALVDKLNQNNTFSYNNRNFNFDFNKINNLYNSYLDQYYQQNGNYNGSQSFQNFDPIQFKMNQMNQSRGNNYSQYEQNRLEKEGFDWSNVNTGALGTPDTNINVVPDINSTYQPSIKLPEATADDASAELTKDGSINEIKLSSKNNILLKTGNFLNGAGGKALNIAGNVAGMFSRGNESYNGPKGAVRAGIDQGWNSIANTVSKMGPYGAAAGKIMQAMSAVNKIQGAIFGSTNGMTTTDAIMDSPLGVLTGVGWINQAFKKKSDTYTKDEEMFASAGNSLSGLAKKADDALEVSGKNYGTFSGGARVAANRILMNMRTMQEVGENNVAEANLSRTLRDSMSSINNNRRFYGSSDFYNIARGKEGMKITSTIKEIKPSIIFKYGGTIEEIKPITIIKEINIFKYGGTIKENPIKYSRERFPILNNLPDIVLQEDFNFNPGHNIEYMEAKYDTLPYYNNYEKKEKGKSTIVYNNKATNEDIALDWLSHGLREYDENWNNYLTQLSEDSNWKNIIKEESFFDWLEQNKIAKDEKSFRALPISIRHHSEELFNLLPINNEIQESRLDSLIRAMLVKPELREQLHYNYPDDILKSLQNSPAWKDAYNYIFNSIDKFAKGGKFNVIPEGALHARLHHMDVDDITKKGIPIISEGKDGEIEQQAEIEREEIILRLEVTEKLEELLKKYNENKDNDQYAIEAGNLLVYEILQNTKDNTNNLI